MPYAINLRLDPATALEIELLQARLVAAGVPERDVVDQFGACVTLLTVSDRVHPDDVTETMERRAPGFAAAPASLGRPCVVAGATPTLGLRVELGDALRAMHYAIFICLPEHEVHLHHRPAHWQPHVKLANARGGPESASALIAALAQGRLPTACTLDRLEVVRYPPVQAIWQAPLKARAA